MHIHQGAGEIAELQLLPHVLEELGGGARAEDGVEDQKGGQIRILHAGAKPPADAELPLVHVQRLFREAGRLFQGVHAQVGADLIVDLAPGQGDERVPQAGADFPLGGTAAVEDLHRTLLQKAVVLAGELFVVDVLALALAAQAAHGEILIAAHFLHAAHERVAALFVDPAADGLQHLFLLTVHILRQQQAAPGGGGEQQTAQQLADLVQNALAAGEKVPLRDAGIEAHTLDIADTAHNRLHRGAVELVHPGGEGLHIRVTGGAPAQNVGNQRVHGRGFPRQLGQQAQAQAGGLEFLRVQGVQPHTGENFGPCQIHGAPPHILSHYYTTTFPKSEEGKVKE